jgi:hypothetical protein
MRVPGLTAVLFLFSTLYTNAGEPLAIAVSPVLSIAPANVVVRVRIAPDAANRTLEVVTESDTYYRRSRVELDGHEAPRMVPLELRDLPHGEYEVRATLIDSAGRPRALAHRLVVVRSPSGSDLE